jgi:hypothetical protein
VAVVGFTGSVATGCQIARDAQAHDAAKFVFAEMGGKSAAIVLEDIDEERMVDVVDNLMFGVFIGNGQACSATSRILVQERAAPALIRRLTRAIEAIVIGDNLSVGLQPPPPSPSTQHMRVWGGWPSGLMSVIMLAAWWCVGHAVPHAHKSMKLISHDDVMYACMYVVCCMYVCCMYVCCILGMYVCMYACVRAYVQPETRLGPLITKRQQDKVLGFVDRALAAGVPSLTGSGRWTPPAGQEGAAALAGGNFVKPVS